MFPLDQPITEESGKLIVAWAAGGKAVQPDWRDEIINAQSLDVLAALWKKIPKDEKAALETAKNTRKKELEIPCEQLI